MARTKRKGIADLLAYVKVKCTGVFHHIGLSRRGHLILFNHDKENLARMETVADLGGSNCRCLQILTAWRTNNLIEADTPRALYQEHPHKLAVAARLQRKLWKVRGVDCPRVKLLPHPDDLKALEKDSKDEDRYYRSTREQRHAIALITKELQRRGWPAFLPNTDRPFINSSGYYGISMSLETDEDPCLNYRMVDPGARIAAFEHARGYFKLEDVTYQFVTTFPDLKSIDLRIAADVMERGILNSYARRPWNAAWDRSESSFEEKVSNLQAETRESPVRGVRIFPDHTTTTIKMEVVYDNLTLPAARLMRELHEEMNEKVEAILRTNKQRLYNPHREPPIPPKGRVEEGTGVPSFTKDPNMRGVWDPNEQDEEEEEEDDDS